LLSTMAEVGEICLHWTPRNGEFPAAYQAPSFYSLTYDRVLPDIMTCPPAPPARLDTPDRSRRPSRRFG
jgi:hypothetical protein